MADACGQLDFTCQTGAAIHAVISKTAADALQELVNHVIDAVGQAFTALGSLWVLVPTPNLTAGTATTASPSAAAALESSGFTTILQYVVWISLAICVMSLIAAGVLLAVNHRRGEGAAHLGRLGIVLGAVILISAAAAIVAALLPARGTSGGSNAVAFLQDSLWWYVAGLAIFSIVVAGARMAWTQRIQPGKDLLQSLLTLVVVSGAGLTGIALAVSAADGFSIWILAGATDKSFSDNISQLLHLSVNSAMGPIPLLILGLIAVIGAFIQIVLMVVRGAMLVLLAGIFPISASFTNTETGRAWFKKLLGWLIAFILYKPAAAIIYAAAFKLVATGTFKDDASGLVSLLTGLALMAMALIALPALMRFVAPMVAQAGGGGGAGMALAAGAGAGASEVATGAIRRSKSSGGGGSSSSSGPSGSSASAAPTASKTASASSAGRGAAAGGAAAGGAGAAAGAAGGAIGIAATAAVKAGKAAGGAAKRATEDVASGGPTGS